MSADTSRGWQVARDGEGRFLLSRDEVILRSISNPAERLRVRGLFMQKLACNDNGCFLWTGTIHSGTGYGIAYLGNRQVNAHRLAWALDLGGIPDATIDHVCRERRCQRVSHMEDVSVGENSARVQRAKTHCPRGHEYTGTNVGVAVGSTGAPYRRCRQCDAERSRARYAASIARAAS